MPWFATVFMIITLSSIGLPPLNGFIGEFLILVGAFQFNVWYGVLAATGVVLGAIYMLWMYQRVFFGEVTNQKNEGLKDLSVREYIVFAPLIVLILLMGVWSKPFITRMEPSVNKFLMDMGAYRGGHARTTRLSNGVEVTLPSSQDEAEGGGMR